LYFAVSGTNQCCLPYVLNKLNFSCWLGNVFPEEAKHYFRTYPFIQKLITIISYPICLYFDKLIYEKAKRILVLSEYMKNKIIERYKVPDDKIWVVPYPIDTDYFSPPVNKNPINGMVRILFVGRINDERKNVQMLLKAFNIISSRNDNVELLLVGDEPSAQLSEFTNKLGLVQKVNFVSDVPHDQIKYFYNISDIFVLPSLQEGLGIVVLEAMSCGIPSVITRCGGPEWLIKDGINGFLVENNNEIEFASAIEKLVDNPDLRLQIGSEARNTIINRCSNKVVEPMLLRALEELKNDNK
jgi:glycosyltransferase involved in cell wall biosynthesis